MKSDAIRYSVLTTTLSVVNGIRVLFLHIRLPQYGLRFVDLTQCIMLLSCSIGSLALACSNTSEKSVAILRTIISVLIPVPWYYQVKLQLSGLAGVDRLLAASFVVFVISCLTKVTAAMIGTFTYSSMWFAVAFLLCVDYIAMSSFYWWLRERTMQGYQTRAQVNYIAAILSFVSALLLLVTIVGTILDRWLLSLEIPIILTTSLLLLLQGGTHHHGSANLSVTSAENA